MVPKSIPITVPTSSLSSLPAGARDISEASTQARISILLIMTAAYFSSLLFLLLLNNSGCSPLLFFCKDEMMRLENPQFFFILAPLRSVERFDWSEPRFAPPTYVQLADADWTVRGAWGDLIGPRCKSETAPVYNPEMIKLIEKLRQRVGVAFACKFRRWSLKKNTSLERKKGRRACRSNGENQKSKFSDSDFLPYQFIAKSGRVRAWLF